MVTCHRLTLVNTRSTITPVQCRPNNYYILRFALSVTALIRTLRGVKRYCIISTAYETPLFYSILNINIQNIKNFRHIQQSVEESQFQYGDRLPSSVNSFKVLITSHSQYASVHRISSKSGHFDRNKAIGLWRCPPSWIFDIKMFV